MEQNDFKISYHNYAIILKKNNQGFVILQSNDDDIWLSTSQEEMNI